MGDDSLLIWTEWEERYDGVDATGDGRLENVSFPRSAKTRDRFTEKTLKKGLNNCSFSDSMGIWSMSASLRWAMCLE